MITPAKMTRKTYRVDISRNNPTESRPHVEGWQEIPLNSEPTSDCGELLNRWMDASNSNDAGVYGKAVRIVGDDDDIFQFVPNAEYGEWMLVPADWYELIRHERTTIRAHLSPLRRL